MCTRFYADIDKELKPIITAAQQVSFAQISYQAGVHFSLIMSEKQNKKGLTMCNGPKKWRINFNNDGDISFEENYLIYENGVFMY
jgi:hypothetical protein